MRLLVLEESDRIINIYKKFFKEKNHDVQIVNNPEECLEKLKGAELNEFEHIIVERAGQLVDGISLEQKMREMGDFDIQYLSSHMNSGKDDLTRETKDIIEKPFAMITLLGYLQLKKQEQIIVN